MTESQLSQLDYRIIKRPILIQGKQENRPFPNRQALIHSKTGQPFDVCSSIYQPHQPEEIATTIDKAITGIATITDVRVLHGGESVTLTCQFNQDIQELHQDDIVGDNSRLRHFQSLKTNNYNATKQARHDAGYRVGQTLGRSNLYTSGFKISIGNTVGSPCKVIGQVTEIACLNGLLRQLAKAFMIVSHRNQSIDVGQKILEAIPELQASTHDILKARQTLSTTPASTEVMRTYLLELTDKDLFAQVLDKTIADRGQYTPDVQRNMFLESVTSHDQVAWFLLDAIDKHGNRLCKRMNNHLTDQPLADGTKGTLWQPYMAATYSIDHQSTGRGEYADDNKSFSQTFGDGAKVKIAALDLINTYQQSMTTLN